MRQQWISQWLCLIVGIIFCIIGSASQDPISWQLIPANGFPVTNIGNASNVTYTLTSNLPRPVVITTAYLNVPGITVQDGCNNVTLAPHTHCQIRVRFAPTEEIDTKFQLIYGYHFNRIPLPELIAATPHGTACIASQAILPLPTNTYQYADNVVKFKITNCLTQNMTLGNVSIVATAGSAIITTNAAYDNCSNITLLPGLSCDITASVIPTSLSNLTITANAPITSSNSMQISASTSASVKSNQQTLHHLFFVNQCNFDVWYGIGNAAGSSGNASPDPNLVAHPSGAPPAAYYLPAQILGKAPSTIDLSTAQYINGAFWPRTGCQMQNGQFNCATGTCATLSNSATCVSGTATLNMPLNPFTKIEATLNASAGTDGVYDVSVINGMTVPVEVKAFGPLGANRIGSSPGNPGDVYTCSAAGAIIQPPGSSLLAACPWTFNPSSSLNFSGVNNDFYWVTPGVDDGCSSSRTPLLCGMAYNVSPSATQNPGLVNRRNGAFLGFNTLASYIGYTDPTQWGSQNLYQVYGMDTALPLTIPSYGAPGNYTVLIGCIYDKILGSANSCNLNNLTTGQYNTCCGCVDWTITTPNTPCGGGSPNWPGAGTNISWTTTVPSEAAVQYTVQQSITWLKSGCPTAYAYQFDDTSSSFQCNTDHGTQLNTSYQITFCPGGINGLPANTQEGRNIPP